MQQTSVEQVDWQLGSRGWMAGAALAIVSGVAFVLATTQGIGVLPDTTRYLRLGPMSYDSPLYAWLLDCIRISQVGFQPGARLAGLLLAVGNSWVIWRAMQRGGASSLLATLGAALVVLSPQFVGIHATAMSEPLFLLTLLIAMHLFLNQLDTGSKAALAAAGGMLGVSMLARFAAAPLAFSWATFLLADARRAWPRRLADIALLAVASGAFFFSWVLTSSNTNGGALGREMAFNGNADFHRWVRGVNSLSLYLFPSQVPMVLRFMLLVALLLVFCFGQIRLGAATLRAVRAGHAPGLASTPLLWGLFAAWYVAFIVLSVSIEANLEIGARYLLPLAMALCIAAVSLLAQAEVRPRSRPLVVMLAPASVILPE